MKNGCITLSLPVCFHCEQQIQADLNVLLKIGHDEEARKAYFELKASSLLHSLPILPSCPNFSLCDIWLFEFCKEKVVGRLGGNWVQEGIPALEFTLWGQNAFCYIGGRTFECSLKEHRTADLSFLSWLLWCWYPVSSFSFFYKKKPCFFSLGQYVVLILWNMLGTPFVGGGRGAPDKIEKLF